MTTSKTRDVRRVDTVGPGRGPRDRAADDRAAAAVRARPAAVDRHRPVGGAAADGRLHQAAGRVLRVPVAAAAADAAAAVAERRLDAADPDARPGRRRRRRPRDHGVRPVRRRRQLRRRRRRVPGPDRDPVPRHQPRRGPHLGSHGAVHPRCDAGTADGHRRGPQCRRHRRHAKRGCAAIGSGAKPTSTDRWTVRSGSRSAMRSPRS